MQDEKSQLQNRERAMKVLRARLYEPKLAEQQAELAADRRAQVGTGERAEKIRTYNFPERRVTDHRVKLTVHNLDAVLAGELDDITARAAGRREARAARAAGRAAEAVSPRTTAGMAVPCGGASGWRWPSSWPRAARVRARRTTRPAAKAGSRSPPAAPAASTRCTAAGSPT